MGAKDLWGNDDDGDENNGPMDLSKLAEDASKFRLEFEQMKRIPPNDSYKSSGNHESDLMDSLINSNDLGSTHRSVESSVSSQVNDTNAAKLPSAEVNPLLTFPEKSSVLQNDALFSNSSSLEFGSLLLGVNSNFQSFEQSTYSLTSLLSKIGVSLEADSSSLGWFYRDPQNQVQGPFKQYEMKVWNEGGYFQPDLPIKLTNWNRFYPFVQVFPDMQNGFNSIPREPTVSLNEIANVPTVLPLNDDKVIINSSASKIETPIVSLQTQPSIPLIIEPTEVATSESNVSNSTSNVGTNADVDRSNLARKLLKVGSFGDSNKNGVKLQENIETPGREITRSPEKDSHPRNSSGASDATKSKVWAFSCILNTQAFTILLLGMAKRRC
jgi:hypothetical protein